MADTHTGKMLLRSGGDRGARRASGDGLLPLRELQALLNRAGERVHVVEKGERERHQRRGVPRPIQEQRNQRPAVLHEVRQPHHGRSSNTGFNRCSPRRAAEFSVQANGTPQLRRNRAADERRPAKAKRFPGGHRRLRRDAAGVTTRLIGSLARHSLLVTASLRQIQRRDVDLIDVAQSVARTVQLLQEFFVAQVVSVGGSGETMPRRFGSSVD